MRKYFHSEAVRFFSTCTIVVYLLLTPLSALAASPILSHRPIKLAKKGQPLNIVAHIGSEAGIQSVYLHLKHDGRTTKGKLPALPQPATVPVQVRVTKDRIPLLSQAVSASRQTRLVDSGTVLDVSGDRNGYYRVHSTDGANGYIPQTAVKILSTGRRYGVAIPSQITSGQSLSYQIQVTDVDGRVAESDWTSVRLVTDEEIAAMQRGAKTAAKPSATSAAKPTATKPHAAGKPLYKKTGFWLAVALTAGGAYFLLNKEDKESSKESNIDVTVEWN